MDFLYVALGGAVGAAARYSISLIPYKGDFPLLTLATNLLGAFLIGFRSGAAERRGACAGMTLFLKTGVCGGFTTFSTFSLEAYKLFEGQKTFCAAIYILLSVGLCLLGVFGGMMLSGKIKNDQ